jgi:3-methyladenine DNA glycosylase AlkD
MILDRIMDTVDSLILRAKQTKNGFLDIKQAAEEVVAGNMPKDSFRLAKVLFESEVNQARSLATFILGHLAATSGESLKFLRTRVSQDEDWGVQEILAKAFDNYCAITGYEQSIFVITDWLADSNPNVRRAVTEGLRIWTSRPYFRDHPDIAIKFLSRLRDDNSEYVRRSVGNALKDISKKHKTLVTAELQSWDISNKSVKQTYKLASKFL